MQVKEMPSTGHPDATAVTRPVSRLRIVRAASTGAFASLWVFLLGWLWAAVGLSGADAYLGLFIAQMTSQPVASAPALGIGSLCAFLVGGIFGAIIAHCYNLAGRVFGD
ncbi:hypothetical protein [uncultured Phenylobacterium sp.]|uniref:hypothetical protein n=1 Tax=uncultured Phenylobacterium sp. TaxID=349273 RepID=UPI0025EC8373|nr:hypothetical protein [uncultured Phenylobacterium sp.]